MKKTDNFVKEVIEEIAPDTATEEAIAGIVADSEEADASSTVNDRTCAEAIIAVLDIPVVVPNKKACDFLKAGIAYGNIVLPEFHFVSDNEVLLRLEIRRVGY